MRITLRKILSGLIFLPAIIQAQNFYYGSCYYPEQVSHEQVRRDAILMKEAGFNVARMATSPGTKWKVNRESIHLIG